MASIDDLVTQTDAVLSILDTIHQSVQSTAHIGSELADAFASMSAEEHAAMAVNAQECVREAGALLTAASSTLKETRAQAVEFKHSTGLAGANAPAHGSSFRMPRVGVVRPDRSAHILDGDPNDQHSGGHLSGTGRSGKTEFPPSWSREKIIAMVADVARNPDRPRQLQSNGRYRCDGQREGVTIRVALGDDGGVITAYPIKGPGVQRNRGRKR